MCVNDDRVGVYSTFYKLIGRRASIVSRRVEKVMNACVIDIISFGKFVVHDSSTKTWSCVFGETDFGNPLNGDFCALVYAIFFRPSRSFKVAVFPLGILLRPLWPIWSWSVGRSAGWLDSCSVVRLVGWLVNCVSQQWIIFRDVCPNFFLRFGLRYVYSIKICVLYKDMCTP